MQIHERIGKIRTTLGLKQNEFADGLGIARPVATMLEKGERGPSRQVLIKMVECYKVNINWLLMGQGEMFVDNKYRELTISEAMPFFDELAHLSDEERKKALECIKSLRKKD